MGTAHTLHRLSLKHCRAVVREAVAELGGSAATVFTGEEDGVLRAVQLGAGAGLSLQAVRDRLGCSAGEKVGLAGLGLGEHSSLQELK